MPGQWRSSPAEDECALKTLAPSWSGPLGRVSRGRAGFGLRGGSPVGTGRGAERGHGRLDRGEEVVRIDRASETVPLDLAPNRVLELGEHQADPPGVQGCVELLQ